MSKELEELYDDNLHYVQCAGNDETYEHYEYFMDLSIECMLKIKEMEGE